jgi:GNAT superfamily N-acetyltransferase
MFRHHHYLNYDINRGARCWITTWKGIPVGFSSAIAFPSGTVRNAWREHRTVVLPEFQGLGIGVRISDTVGEMFLSQGCRYFSKTSHPRMGEYRNRSPLWKATSKNGISRKDYLIEGQPSPKARPGMGKNENLTRHAMRVCYSHEYIGEGVSL